jgi:hypothetical protein
MGVNMNDIGPASYKIVELYQSEILVFVIAALVLSQLLEAVGHWLADKPKRDAGEKLPWSSRLTAYGRVLKLASFITLLIALVKAQHG